MVIVLDAQAAVTPDGRPVAAPIPVAPVVAMVTLALSMNTQSVGFDEAVPVVFAGVTVIVPVAPAVLCVIVVKGELLHKVGVDDAAPTVFKGVTIIVPVALTEPQPPVKGIE